MPSRRKSSRGKDLEAVAAARARSGMVRTGEAARLAGISAQQLNYYMMVGIVEAADHTDAGQRLFDHNSIRRIRMIRALNRSGYPLREIKEIFMEGR